MNSRSPTLSRWLRVGTVAALAAGAALSSGCSNLGAKPWQRATLSRPDMQVESAPLQASFDDHVYFSKEASSGGRGFGGGGCGCN